MYIKTGEMYILYILFNMYFIFRLKLIKYHIKLGTMPTSNIFNMYLIKKYI